jgi:hypothetical protein
MWKCPLRFLFLEVRNVESGINDGYLPAPVIQADLVQCLEIGLNSRWT